MRGQTLRACGIAALLLALAAHSADAPTPFASDMLASHNAIRKRVGVPPLRWSERLEDAARDWAETLMKRNRFEHNPRTPYGENLWDIQGGVATPSEMVEDWASEERNYNYASNSCRGVCGHYTQIVWRQTREVGCAVARAGNREVCVCEYNPPGNYVGQRPY